MAKFNLLGFIIRSVMMGMITALFLFVFFPHLMAPAVKMVDAPAETVKVLSFAAAIKKVAPSIVNIRTLAAHKKNASTVNFGFGSGIIISAQGYIVTNYHVIEKAVEIVVELTDGRGDIAKVVGYDQESDLAVLKIALTDIPAISMNADVNVQVGDVALVIGHPFGVGQSVTMGVVSATGRKALGLSEYENYIQTDAVVNQGNSGGALINSKGDLIGISSAFFTYGAKIGISFSIPISQAMDVIQQIIFNGHVVRGWLGFSGGPLLKQNDRDKFGDYAYVIDGISKGGPADAAGLKLNDLILAVDGKTVKTVVELINLIVNSKAGSEMIFKINRNDEILTIKAIIQQRPRPDTLVK